jgi:hypothetical protein
VNQTRGPEGSDDLLFSPMRNPTAPGGEMLDERSPDSVLFDVRKLGESEDPTPTARSGSGARTAEEEASGLIDVKRVLAEPPDTPAPSPVVERLTTPTAEQPPPELQRDDRLRTWLMLACMITLLVVGALLVFKAVS